MGITYQSSADRRRQRIDADTLDALSSSYAIIAFDPQGTILSANENFLAAMGYSLSEIEGQSHAMFVGAEHAASEEYRGFWRALRDGQHQTRTFKRYGKAGKAIWIEASYNPLKDAQGKVYRVVKLATDVTDKQRQADDARAKITAISRSQAVIEFNPDGTIIDANDNFCQTLGYSLDEIRGRHHRMFVRQEDADSAHYHTFWSDLARGEFKSAEYLRVGRGGREIWIQASYNPIFDAEGKPYKIVKFAVDITARKSAVNTLGLALEELREGHLDCAIDQAFPSDLEPVRSAFNQSVARFADIVGQLRSTSGTLRSATSEILSGANDLSERTTQQAASIEETSAAMKQLAGTVEDNARKAESATQKSESAQSLATESGAVMTKATAAMESITNSSSKISNIIGMIDDIAFQTNLLALNASVEAARAGEAGKGFAVVAVEVRRLAQSAAEASAEVKKLIEQSSEEVSGGSRLVSAAADKLQTLLSAVQENSGLIQDIAVASRGQASSIDEVSEAVGRMDEMTQQNAALVEETNAAIEQTEGQATRLDELVEEFKLGAAAGQQLAASPRRGETHKAAIHKATTHKAATPKTAPPRVANGNVAIDQDWSEF